MIRLDRQQRREIVAEISEAGMSTRAIASGLGINKETVVSDRQVYGSRTPGATTGLDGKTYPSRQAPPSMATGWLTSPLGGAGGAVTVWRILHLHGVAWLGAAGRASC